MCQSIPSEHSRWILYPQFLPYGIFVLDTPSPLGYLGRFNALIRGLKASRNVAGVSTIPRWQHPKLPGQPSLRDGKQQSACPCNEPYPLYWSSTVKDVGPLLAEAGRIDAQVGGIGNGVPETVDPWRAAPAARPLRGRVSQFSPSFLVWLRQLLNLTFGGCRPR